MSNTFRKVKWELDTVRGNDYGFRRDIKLPRARRLAGLGEIEHQFGTTSRVEVSNERHFYLHEPLNFGRSKRVPLLVVFHGSRGNALYMALEITRWIERTPELGDFIIAFGQAEISPYHQVDPIVAAADPGNEYAWMHPFYGITFGERYWEIRDYEPKFQQDVAYAREIVETVEQGYNIDPSRKLYLGHSNGGVFCLQLMIHEPNLFTAYCSHMGGIGYDPNFIIDFDAIKQEDKKPLLLVTGDKDVHLTACLQAKEIFENEEFPSVEIIIQEDLEHIYRPAAEPAIWEWFLEVTKHLVN